MAYTRLDIISSIIKLLSNRTMILKILKPLLGIVINFVSDSNIPTVKHFN